MKFNPVKVEKKKIIIKITIKILYSVLIYKTAD